MQTICTLGAGAFGNVSKSLNKKTRSTRWSGEYVVPEWAWKSCGLPVPEHNHKFHPTRRWKIDYAWPDVRLAVEIEGGIWSKSRHAIGQGFVNDIEKYNAVVEAGWALLRYQPRQLDFRQIRRVYDRIRSRGGVCGQK